MYCNVEHIKKFLINAKINTYASNSGRVFQQTILPDTKLLAFEQDDLVYRDIYFGFLQFAGQETVSLKDKVIWSMNYIGQSQTKENIDDIYAFLRKSLLKISIDAPFRGPAAFSDSCGFYYKNQSEGDIDFFHGEESISQNGVIVYKLYYSGGGVVK